MEIANNPTAASAVRSAHRRDLETLHQLLREQFYTHTHVDWHTLADWLDCAGFVVWEHELIHAFLTVTAAPPPAAWVRAVSLRYSSAPKKTLTALFEQAINQLKAQNITTIGWMSNKRWPDRWLPDLGFDVRYHIEAYHKNDLTIPPHKTPQNLFIRSVLPEEIKQLAHLEALVFDPLWRHDARGLHLAWRESLSLDVAFLNGRLIGFQHSVPADKQGAHLARMTIHPDVQGQGIGSTLLAYAINGYKKRDRTHVTLNTQTGNTAAQHLYTKFGFYPIDYRLPVWVRKI